MKKILSRVSLGVGAVVGLAVLAAFINFYLLSPKARAATEAKAPSTPEAIARGEYLANHVMGCMACHSPVDETKPGEPLVEGKIGSGRDFGDNPEAFPGHVRAPNLTPDSETGIGAWTDGEVLRAMREGIDKNGRPLFPMMPYMTYAQTMSDEDALAIIAYLRSLKPIKNDAGITELKFPVSMFIRSAPKPLEKPAGPPPTEPLARGQWLIRAASCPDCHSTWNARHEPIPDHYLAGGNPFFLPGKGVVFSANITSDKETGIGGYTDEEILRALEQGVTKSGRHLYAMPWTQYAGMTPEDKKALVLALRQVPPVKNVVAVGGVQN
jgi:hypothetical protein